MVIFVGRVIRIVEHVLIWINGAFGAGKTHTAFELHRRLPDAHVADPELIGFALRRALPPECQPDFQDLPQWRAGVVETDNRSTDEVVEWIAADAGLHLSRPCLSPIAYQFRRLAVGVRHIR
ncbi:hypothetical protein [Enemella evansiae]|uniref:hypothetical protein n=1 Tax=Enemella evansiae TaxID=2016499 RepID=UPI0010D705E7|nr:hypothetical protein [Enemella evansiae]TDO93201.1 hypothetical protein C8D81_0980 [Enemella evansiae]